MTIQTVTWNLELVVREILDFLDMDQTGTAPVNEYSLSGLSGTAGPSGTTIVATNVWRRDLTLSGGVLSTDFTVLDRGSLPDEDFSGLKLQFVAIKNPAGNSALRAKTGASNGLGFAGSSASDITIPANGAGILIIPEGTVDISGSAKTIDWSGGTTDSFSVLFVAA